MNEATVEIFLTSKAVTLVTLPNMKLHCQYRIKHFQDPPMACSIALVTDPNTTGVVLSADHLNKYPCQSKQGKVITTYPTVHGATPQMADWGLARAWAVGLSYHGSPRTDRQDVITVPNYFEFRWRGENTSHAHGQSVQDRGMHVRLSRSVLFVEKTAAGMS